MLDFLSFKNFISKDILILAYYLGAIITPLFLWRIRLYLARKFYIIDKIHQMQADFYNTLNNEDKLRLIIFLLMMFIIMEIIWRMMFEFMIAYFEMRDYLQIISIQYPMG